MPPPPPIDRSFTHESVLFGTAGLESSSLRADSEFEIVLEAPMTKKPAPENIEMEDQRPLITEIARNTRVDYPREEPQVAPTVARLPMRFVSHAFTFLSDIASLVGEIISAIFFYIAAALDW